MAWTIAAVFGWCKCGDGPWWGGLTVQGVRGNNAPGSEAACNELLAVNGAVRRRGNGMRIGRRLVVIAGLFALMGTMIPAGLAQSRPEPITALSNWYGLMLELVRHTPGYSPPVASRAFAYLGVTAFEATVGGSDKLISLAGQMPGLKSVPERQAGAVYDDAIVLNAAMTATVRDFFFNTGPTGQRAIDAADKKWGEELRVGGTPEVIERSEAYGKSIAAAIFDWSKDDGGADIVNMGFRPDYVAPVGPDKWVPTSATTAVVIEQVPLLPDWGNNRPFAMAKGACRIPAPIPYSEDPESEFYRQALEVYDTVKMVSAEKEAIAHFWSDDPALSTTPPGHWLSVVLQIADKRKMSLDDRVDVLARLGVGLADAFIGCWREKYTYNRLRPITYIKRYIDPNWEPLLNTPPFPEYPSGHSTSSGAAATILSAFFGEHFAYDDATGSRDGLNPRSFPDFWTAADEASVSRVYGGIHFRAAIEAGHQQGFCIGASAVALKTRR